MAAWWLRNEHTERYGYSKTGLEDYIVRNSLFLDNSTAGGVWKRIQEKLETYGKRRGLLTT